MKGGRRRPKPNRNTMGRLLGGRSLGEILSPGGYFGALQALADAWGRNAVVQFSPAETRFLAELLREIAKAHREDIIGVLLYYGGASKTLGNLRDNRNYNLVDLSHKIELILDGGASMGDQIYRAAVEREKKQASKDRNK